MQIDVTELMAADVGATKVFTIKDEPLSLDDLDLRGGSHGEVRLLRLADGLQATGRIAVELISECQRCLTSFDLPVTARFDGYFSTHPGEDIGLIAANRQDWQIDLGSLLRQEIILSIPVKVVCRPDCLGLCVICGEVQSDRVHQHT